MKKTMCWIGLWACAAAAHAQFEGFVNHGLAGVGRLPAGLYDQAGPGRDTLGGLFSSMAVDPSSLVYEGGQIRGVLWGLPDRGFGDGATDYRPRVQKLGFGITPFLGGGTAPGQGQIVFTNLSTVLFTYGGTNFTGFDGGSTNAPVLPQSPAGSIGGGRLSIDPEGLVLLPDGGFWVSDEYGPALYRFNAQGELLETLLPPPALLPRNAAGTLNFTGASAPAYGRRNNRGLEGLSITPDGRRLVAVLQSPTIQDGGAGNLGRMTRVLQFDVSDGSPTRGQVVAEHLYQLTLNGTAQTNRHTPVSELLVVNPTTFLLLERDSLGLGVGTNTPPSFKRVVVASTLGATNVAGGAYDLAPGTPGQANLPANQPPSGVAPLARKDLIDLIDPADLARFGLNVSTNQDANTISEKWEALGLVPLKDPTRPDDYLLLVGNDNDFKSQVVFHNGVAVGTNDVPVDNMLLAYHVTLPGVGAPAPALSAPSVAWTLPATDLYAAGPLTLGVSVYDDDGRVMKAEFLEDGVPVGTATGFPFRVTIPNPAPGQHVYVVRVTDNDGLTAEATRTLQVTASNQPPQVAVTAPAASLRAPANVAAAVSTSDLDGSVVQVQYRLDDVAIPASTNAPFGVTLPFVGVGPHQLVAVATDNLGLSSTSAPVSFTVLRATSAPLSLQVLHASDFEAGIPALDDAVGFSRVLNALRTDFPTNTLVLSSGDNYIPGPFFTASADPAAPYNGVKGRADIAILNALGIQVSAAGNHEFDDNTAQFASMLRADAAAGYAGTLFPYLSANLDFNADSNTRTLITADAQDARLGTNKVARSCTVQVGGQLVGLVGATTIELRQISTPGSIAVSTNLVGTIQAAVDGLLARGCNKVILLAHLQQYANEFALATRLRDVDLIIAGGSHVVFAKPSDRLRPGQSRAENYPTAFTSPSGEPVHVVNAGANFEYVGRWIASFDEEGRVAVIDGRSGAYATDAEGVASTGSAPAHPAITNIVGNLGGIIDGKDGRRFGRTTVYLNGLRASVRTEESNLGNLTADANLWRAQQADPGTSLSLKNGGGIRDSIGGILSSAGSSTPVFIPPPANPRVGKQAGEVSQLDIENALRFNNGLSLLTLTAQQLRDAMEWAVAATTATATPGQFPQVSGMSFSFDISLPAMTYTRSTNNVITGINNPGQRLRSLVARRANGSLDLVVENGVLVGDPGRTFRMVTLEFLATGGDSYYPLSLGSGVVNLVPAGIQKTFDTDGAEQRALADYLQVIGTYTAADTGRALDERIQNLGFRSDSTLRPAMTSLASDAGGSVVSFTTLPGKSYRLESQDLLGGGWQAVGDAITGDGSIRQLGDPSPAAPMRFYRVRVP
ncbi:MAG: esterase-like activity of phytase family protein [Verrucomicrobiota bacterium]